MISFRRMDKHPKVNSNHPHVTRLVRAVIGLSQTNPKVHSFDLQQVKELAVKL
jgi:hypothetical protein